MGIRQDDTTPGTQAAADAVPTRRLDRWLSAHGPLPYAEALVLALRVCSRVSSMSHGRAAATLPSLRSSAVERRVQEGWTWAPEPGRPATTVDDAEVLERVGALLYECLSGESLPAWRAHEAEIAGRLRTSAPGVPSSVVELTARACVARGHGGASLTAFAEDVRAALGVARRRAGLGRGARAGIVLAAAALATTMLVAAFSQREAPVASHGLTADETTLIDIKTESADYLAAIGEHTAALQELQDVERVWAHRVALGDPRLAWSRARQAWVRGLAGDRLTAEQLLEPYRVTLRSVLGDAHPYARALGLDLADVVEARGVADQAAALRAEGARALSQTVRSPALSWEPAGAPWPPHVLAHAAPNVPEREGFRHAPEGGYRAPLTSTQRLLAALDGWRLHVRALAECHVSVVVGADPRSISVAALRAADGTWTTRLAGTAPVLEISSPASDSVGLTVSASRGGEIAVQHADGTRRETRVDEGAPPPAPPYALTFSSRRDAAGCAVVWWEILAR